MNNRRYSSDDDNDGKWYDEHAAAFNRKYLTDVQLYDMYLKQCTLCQTPS